MAEITVHKTPFGWRVDGLEEVIEAAVARALEEYRDREAQRKLIAECSAETAGRLLTKAEADALVPLDSNDPLAGESAGGDS